VPYVRTVTSSGAAAVRFGYSCRRGSREIEHLGSANDFRGVGTDEGCGAAAAGSRAGRAGPGSGYSGAGRAADPIRGAKAPSVPDPLALPPRPVIADRMYPYVAIADACRRGYSSLRPPQPADHDGAILFGVLRGPIRVMSYS
jgi:hypothetical protein